MRKSTYIIGLAFLMASGGSCTPFRETALKTAKIIEVPSVNELNGAEEKPKDDTNGALLKDWQGRQDALKAFQSFMGHTIIKWGTVPSMNRVALPWRVTIQNVDTSTENELKNNTNVDVSADLKGKQLDCEGGAKLTIKDASLKKERTRFLREAKVEDLNAWDFGAFETKEYCNDENHQRYTNQGDKEDWVIWSLIEVETIYEATTTTDLGAGANAKCQFEGVVDASAKFSLSRTAEGKVDAKHTGWHVAYVQEKGQFCGTAKSWLRMYCPTKKELPACSGDWFNKN